jgi:hypothetical protein
VRSSTYRQSGQKIPTDNKSGVLVMLFVLLLIAGVLAGLWFFVVEDLVSQLQTVRDALSPTQLATTGGR